MLVREFESRRGEILSLIAKIRRDQLLRARIIARLSTIRHEPYVVGRGGEELAMYVTPDLSCDYIYV